MRVAGRSASTGYATDRLLVLREQLRRLEVELASAHEALRQAKTRSCKTLIGRGEGSCARLARDETDAANCGCRTAMRSITSNGRAVACACGLSSSSLTLYRYLIIARVDTLTRSRAVQGL